jgi:hypothetical protein
MTDESFPVRRKIGLERGYDGRQYAADALSRGHGLALRHQQKKAESPGLQVRRVKRIALAEIAGLVTTTKPADALFGTAVRK